MREAKDEAEQKAIDDIRAFKIYIIHVHDNSQGPSFTYSIGLFESYAHPEIILFGLKLEQARVLVNNMAFDIKEGKTFSAGEFHEGVLDDFLLLRGGSA